jgi:hypothetical protein
MSAQGVAMTRQRIASGGDKADERARIKQDYTRARGLYLQTTASIVKLHDAIAEAKANVKHCQDNQKGVEAGWGTPDGKNAEERKKLIERWRAIDEDWKGLADAIRINEEFIVKQEAVLLNDEYQARIARLDMEMAIAEMRAIAGEDERHER